VPTRKDIPQPETRPTDNTSQVIMRYINTLLETGHASEAATIGTLYEALIHSNSMALPVAAGSELAQVVAITTLSTVLQREEMHNISPTSF
jgi:hypothetical protein